MNAIDRFFFQCRHWRKKQPSSSSGARLHYINVFKKWKFKIMSRWDKNHSKVASFVFFRYAHFLWDRLLSRGEDGLEPCSEKVRSNLSCVDRQDFTQIFDHITKYTNTVLQEICSGCSHMQGVLKTFPNCIFFVGFVELWGIETFERTCTGSSQIGFELGSIWWYVLHILHAAFHWNPC